ncbi:hypothetical protein Scep_021996 [Stephania cephalantha]|uniref:Uncharacterized protein n=1 Tax=Stephania cephalantha TaxID=152367 RepID=A0AAP0FA16_9MAGN
MHTTCLGRSAQQTTAHVLSLTHCRLAGDLSTDSCEDDTLPIMFPTLPYSLS